MVSTVTTMSGLTYGSRRAMRSATTACNNIFVVFGANVGNIGGKLAERLLVNDPTCEVHLASRSDDTLRVLQSHLDGFSGGPGRVHTTVMDAVNDPNAVDEFFAKRLDRVTGVANCIGSVILKPAHSTTNAEWRSTLDTNATSAFHILRAASKKMMRGQDGGSIALCASAVALHGVQNHEAIAAAKGAVAAMTKSAASTYAPKNIRVNAVAPGLIETPMTSKITSNEAARKASEAMHALKRIGTPSHVAAALEFFLNPENDFVTGQVLGVCGGLSSARAQ